MIFSTLALSILALAGPQDPAVQASDYTGLMPSDTTIVVRIESLNSLRKTMVSLNDLIAPEEEFPSVADMLVEVLELPFHPEGVDATRPIYVGLAVSPIGMQRTYLIPVSDAESLMESASFLDLNPEVRGNWVGLTTGPQYTPTTTNAIIGKLIPGVVSARVDLEALMDTFGPIVEIGLAQARIEIQNQMEQVPSPMDMDVLFDLYFDGIELLLHSAESLDLALVDNGKELTLHGSYRALEGSALADLMDPLPLPATLPVTIPSDSPITYVMVANMGALFTKFSPLFEDIVEIYPEDMRDPLTEYMGILPGMLKGFGNTTVGFGGFYPDGLKFDYFSEYKSDVSFAEACKSMATEANSYLGSMGSSIGEPSQVEIDGVQVTQMPITLDYDKLNASFSTGLDQGQGSDQIMDWMKVVYGEKPVVSMAQVEDRIWLHIGDSNQSLQEGVALLKAGPAPAAQTFAALPGLPASAHPFITYRMEMVSLMKAVQPMLEASGLQFELPDTQLNMTTWMGIDGRDFIGGFSINPSEVKAFFDIAIGEFSGSGPVIRADARAKPPTVTSPEK